MIEILCLLIGFLAGFAMCLHGYYIELDRMSVEELRKELVDIRNILETENDLFTSDDQSPESLDPLSKMRSNHVNNVMNRSHTHDS